MSIMMNSVYPCKEEETCMNMKNSCERFGSIQASHNRDSEWNWPMW
jgi:hypothetical protein